MRFWKLSLIGLILLACGVFAPVQTETGTPAASVTAVILTPTPAPSDTPPPTGTPTPAPSATLSLPTHSPESDSRDGGFGVRLHPDGSLFVGDRVSFEVIAPPEQDVTDLEVHVSLADGSLLGTAGFERFGIQGRRQATLRWVWDTRGLDPGDYPVRFQVLPEGETFTRTVTLLPESMQAFPEPDASWAHAESDCCLLYYVTGSAAGRDIETLAEIVDAQALSASKQIGADFQDAISIVFLPRVLGHGGFASGEIYVSYLDRNYAGNDVGQVLHHELIHILDGRKGGDVRPTLFVEGLAVYLSEGHFKKEPILPRAAALLDLDWYLPLDQLVDDFYFSQHEISYLEAAALIQYMVDTYGWGTFDTFYRNIRNQPGPGHVESINKALDFYFGLTLDELEAQFLAFLKDQPGDPDAREDLRLTVTYFDTVRRYQQALDPSAYFLTAWLVGIDEMLDQGITADYVRHPASPENIALELMLVEADAGLREGDFEGAETSLVAVNVVLDAMEAGLASPFYGHPLAEDYLAITLTLLDQGYEPQQLVLMGQQARVFASRDSTDLEELVVSRGDQAWELLSQ